MQNVLIRNIPDAIMPKIKAEAKRRNRSVQKELLECIVLNYEHKDSSRFSDLFADFKGAEGPDMELTRDSQSRNFSFEE